MNDKVSIAMVGLGAWGTNVLRNFVNLNDSKLLACCDVDEKKLARVKNQLNGVYLTTNPKDIFQNDDIDAVIVAAPPARHFEISREALLHGKNVFVEKPMTLSLRDAHELVGIAAQKEKVLMVGHLMEYHPAVERLKVLIEEGELGEIYYICSQRVNLGVIRSDENALWSFAPHDISVILYLLNEEPTDVTARGGSYIQEGIEDVVFVNLGFNGRKMAHIQLSWLDPHKIRKITIVGSKKMAVFDDMESSEKLKIYDKGVNHQPSALSYNDSLTLRYGDILIPSVKMVEPLKIECQHFLDCIKNGKRPRSDGRDGLRVIGVLEAAQKSLDQAGMPVQINQTPAAVW